MSRSTPPIVGLDFGTTNSALAVLGGDGRARLAQFTERGRRRGTFRSVLFFDEDHTDDSNSPIALAGPEAIHRYLEHGSGRFIQSTKTYLASDLFESTMIHDRSFSLETLVGLIIRSLRAEAEVQLGPLGERVVVGRPVRYARSRCEEDEQRALTRMRTALAMAGFTDVTFEYEPVAAAWAYEQTLDHDELVLIADFGGGTSDFTLTHVGPSHHARADAVIATDGVATAGDVFDGRVVREVIAPALGFGSRYRSGLRGVSQPVPAWIYGKLRKWHHLSFLKSPATRRTLEQIHYQADEPEKIEALIAVVEEDLGFHMYQSVVEAKTALSDASETTLLFDAEVVQIEAPVVRAAFEAWIAADLAKISRCFEGLLAREGVGFADVDRVFLTGGSSLVPAVQQLFITRFGAGKVLGGEALTTVASGLALRAGAL